jgi:hypothetical protein
MGGIPTAPWNMAVRAAAPDEPGRRQSRSAVLSLSSFSFVRAAVRKRKIKRKRKEKDYEKRERL